MIMMCVSFFLPILFPILWKMWIYDGTGNANFYYALNLVLSVSQVLFLTEFVSAALKNDHNTKKEKPKKE
jgi:phosphatidylinositol glycan class U